MKRLTTLARDDRGTALIEMGLMLPILAALVIGMVDISRGYSAKLQLEQAAQRAIEKAMNGDKETALFQTLKNEAMAAAGVDESAVTVRYWLECNGVSQNSSPGTMDADYGKKCDDNVPYSRYVNVRIQKSYMPMFNTEWLGANADGSFTLIGETGIRVQ